MDFIHHYSKRKSLELGRYIVPDVGFPCNYPIAFSYVIENGLSPVEIYPWVGYLDSSKYLVVKRQIANNEKIHIGGCRPLFTDG